MDSETTAVLAPLKALALPDTRALGDSAKKAEARALACVITTDEEYELAAGDLQAVKARWDRIEEQRTAITGPMNTALRAVNALFAAPLALLKAAETGYKNAMLAYTAEQRMIAEKARIEAVRIATEARVKAEQEAAELRERAELETAVGNAPEAEAMLQAAEAKTMEAAITIAPSVPARVVPKVGGIATVRSTDFEVENIGQLLVWIVSNMESRPEVLNYVVANEKALRAQVRATGMATRIGGVRVFEKDAIRA